MLKSRKVYLGATIGALAVLGVCLYYNDNVYQAEGYLSILGDPDAKPAKINRAWDSVKVTSTLNVAPHGVYDVTYTIDLKSKEVAVEAKNGSGLSAANSKSGYVAKVANGKYYLKFYDQGEVVFDPK